MRYLDLPLVEINKLLKEKKIKPIDLVNEAFENIEKHKEYNAYITLNKEEAIKEAKELENKEVDNLFFGIPIAVKDNIVTKGLRTTCASHMLDNFIPPYNATVVEKIKARHMIIVGKTNMDEFAMGSSSRTSYFGPPRNPWNKNKISGGTSGGSAVTIASRDVPIALGSDTGGSIRQPSAYNGIVGLKPTYGRVSRFGLVAYASSFDQIGAMTRNVYENALLLQTIVGHDDKDLTSSKKDNEDFTRLIGKSIKGTKVAIPNFFVSDIVSKDILDNIKEIVKLLEKSGATVDYVDMKYIENTVTLYQIIAMGEASSNLARYDGIRYGYSHENPKDIDELYYKTRAEGFGEEVKKRIMVGSYLLSGENAKIYYDKALSIRDDIRKEFKRIFKTYDWVIGPTTATTAYDLDDPMDDPSKSFLDDVLVMPANMAGLPGINVPIGFGKDKMPIGLHIIGDSFEEAKLYQIASFIENELNLDLNPWKGEEHE